MVLPPVAYSVPSANVPRYMYVPPPSEIFLLTLACASSTPTAIAHSFASVAPTRGELEPALRRRRLGVRTFGRGRRGFLGHGADRQRGHGGVRHAYGEIFLGRRRGWLGLLLLLRADHRRLRPDRSLRQFGVGRVDARGGRAHGDRVALHVAAG